MTLQPDEVTTVRRINKETGEIDIISVQVFLQKVVGYYRDTALLVDSLIDGQEINTPFFYYDLKHLTADRR